MDGAESGISPEGDRPARRIRRPRSLRSDHENVYYRCDRSARQDCYPPVRREWPQGASDGKEFRK